MLPQSRHVHAFERLLLSALLTRAERLAVMSDLSEMYEQRRLRDGERSATNWLHRQIRQYPLRILADRAHRLFRFHASTTTLARANRPKPGRGAMPSFLRDIRYNLRSLAKTPVFALTIIFTVGLGIGGTTAVFSIVNAVLLQPLPYPEADRLVRIYTDIGDGNTWGFSMADYLALDEQQTSFEGVGMFRNGTRTFNRDEVAERIPIRRVTASLLPLLGIVPLHGRQFTDADGGEPVVMISYGFWRRHFGADVGALGQSIRIDGEEKTVVGVLPREIGPLMVGRDVFETMKLDTPRRKGPFGMRVIARLRENTSRDLAAQELHAINDRIFPLWQESWPNQASTWAMKNLREVLVGDVGKTLAVVLGAVLLVLLLASTNAAGLLVARGLRRRRELAVRVALGASRRRLLQHLLSESAVLAVGGAGLGFLMTIGGIRLVTSAGSEFIPRVQEIGLTGPVLLFFLAISGASLLLFGLIPSLQIIRSNIEDDLQGTGARSTASSRARHLRRVLVASQFAITVPLLIGGGLLISSLARLARVDPGFDPSNVLTVRISLGNVYSDRSRSIDFWNEAMNRIRNVPGVQAAGLAAGRPPLEHGFGNNFVLEDRPTAPGDGPLSVPWIIVSPEYFDALGIPLIQGRMLDSRDDTGEFAVLVDQRWARRFYADEADALGRRFRHGGCTSEGCPWATVVGVVGNVKYTGLENPGEGQIYVSHGRWMVGSMWVIARTTTDPLSVLPSIRSVIREIDPALPLSRIATMRELMRDSLNEPRYLTILVAGFAAVALVLSVVGVYGVMVYFVQQHAKDIGIRIALGCGPTRVRNLVVRNAMQLAVIGIGIGVISAWVLARSMTSLLFEVQANDPLTFMAVGVGMLTTALAACLMPARRAVRTNPIEALRDE